jgi:hypothetical protein
MIHNASFRRKVIYLGLIALLLIPLYVVGHPAVGDPSEAQSSPGGRLAQLRAAHDLSPAELGEIDPTSESMKLATLGMRGIAANILWTKANEYKKKENWEGLVAVVNQMARLQPNFISVWEFQSHNLSYNISVEQDDYRFRYAWVKKGIEFLIQGTKYNRREPKLFWNLGWFTGQKFGRADEHKQFRRLYRTDHDFHDLQQQHIDLDPEANGPDGKPDTWLTSRLWFERAYNIVDTQGKPVRGKSPHIFYADGPKARMNYSVAIEDEGYLDEKAEASWRKAGEEWVALGYRQVPTSWGPVIRLIDEEKLRADSQRFAEELEKIAPGVREAIRNRKIASLSERERRVLNMAESEIRDPGEYHTRVDASAKTAVTHMEVAAEAPADVRAHAHRLAQQAIDAETIAGYVHRYRENVNYQYWRARCDVEQMPNTVQARKHVFTAKQLAEKAEFDEARAEFEKAWDLWALTIESHPSLVDQLTADDLVDDIKAYVTVLGQIDAKLPDDFKLKALLERHQDIPSSVRPASGQITTGETAPSDSSESTTSKSVDAEKEKTNPAPQENEDPEKKDTEKRDPEKKDSEKDTTKAEASKSNGEKGDPEKTEPGKSDSID